MSLSIDEVVATNVKKYIECFDSTNGSDGKIIYTCRIDGCGKKYTEKSSSIRHLKKHHKEAYDNIKSEQVALHS